MAVCISKLKNYGQFVIITTITKQNLQIVKESNFLN